MQDSTELRFIIPECSAWCLRSDTEQFGGLEAKVYTQEWVAEAKGNQGHPGIHINTKATQNDNMMWNRKTGPQAKILNKYGEGPRGESVLVGDKAGQ